MKNLQQIKVIHTALCKQKERMMAEIAKINYAIKRKNESIKKILSYQGEYSDENKFKLSKQIPILNQNLNTFKRKLNDIIIAEENEIEKLLILKNEKISEIEKINRKIELMDKFKANTVAELDYRSDILEQAEMDEVSSGSQIRSKDD